MSPGTLLLLHVPANGRRLPRAGEALPLEAVLVASARAGAAAPTEPSREGQGTVNVKIKKITQ